VLKYTVNLSKFCKNCNFKDMGERGGEGENETDMI
jgi:hypothetical protein